VAHERLTNSVGTCPVRLPFKNSNLMDPDQQWIVNYHRMYICAISKAASTRTGKHSWWRLLGSCKLMSMRTRSLRVVWYAVCRQCLQSMLCDAEQVWLEPQPEDHQLAEGACQGKDRQTWQHISRGLHEFYWFSCSFLWRSWRWWVSIFVTRRSALAQNLLWRRGCLCVCHLDVLCPNDWVDQYTTFTRL